MSLINNTIILSSTTRAIKKAKATGKLNTDEIFSFILLNNLIDFVDGTIVNGSSYFKETKSNLLLLIQNLVYRNPDTICNYKTAVNTNNLRTISQSVVNTAPTVSGITIPILLEDSYTFKVSDFTTNFSDTQRDTWDKLLIYPNSNLTYKGNVVTNILNIKVEDVINLVYTRSSDAAFSTPLTFRISDKNLHSLYSAIITNTITGTLIEAANLPPTLGDGSVYTDNRITTILTLAMFTTLLAPPYNDPEGDLIDAIRIDSVSGANQGVFYLNSIPVTAGLIITREQLAANLFTHMGPNVDTVASDYFTFSARDEGSLTWVN